MLRQPGYGMGADAHRILRVALLPAQHLQPLRGGSHGLGDLDGAVGRCLGVALSPLDLVELYAGAHLDAPSPL